MECFDDQCFLTKQAQETKQETGKLDQCIPYRSSILMSTSVGNNITKTIFYWHKCMFLETN